MKMPDYFKLFQKRTSTAGWTLLELLTACALSVVVVGGAGFGLLSILQNNKIATATSTNQHYLNMGVEFISDEVKTASVIDSDLSKLSTDARFFTATYSSEIASGLVIPILSLKIDGLDERVVYFLRDKSKETSSTSTVWSGPMMLYRWGPNYSSTGNYNIDDPDPTTTGESG